MHHPITIKGFEKDQLVLETSGLFGSKLLVNGQPAPKAAGRGRFLLHRDDGVEVVAYLRRKIVDPVPDIIVDNQTIKVVEPFNWYQWGLVGLPILLFFFGGCIGPLYGLLAIMAIARIFRSRMNGRRQYLLASFLSVGPVLVFLLLALNFAASRSQVAWQEVSGLEGDFSIVMPGRPAEQTETVSNEYGQIAIHIFYTRQQAHRYMVSYADYGEIRGTSPADFLDKVGAGIVGEQRLLTEDSIWLGEYPGRHLKIETVDDDTIIQARIFLVDDRLYQLITITPPDHTTSNDIQKFFDSFVLLDE